MDSVTLENYRCFRERQTARLAPLTLLVGENSAGKTSFLALLRALWDVAVYERVPDFRSPPYELGSFSDIVYSDSTNSAMPSSFRAELEDMIPEFQGAPIGFGADFEDRGGIPYPVRRRFSSEDDWFEVESGTGEASAIHFGVGARCVWTGRDDSWRVGSGDLTPVDSVIAHAALEGRRDDKLPNKKIAQRLTRMGNILRAWRASKEAGIFSGAPIRSRPKRTYDPAHPYPDPEGEYVTTYLANVSRRDSDGWQSLKDRLEQFGQDSELFDEIHVESFGKTEAAPFQIHVRKFGKRRKGLHRNLIDVGYGVSQVLPLVTELLRPDAPSLFLLQQPEVHLHPSAQAALGSLFCSVAGPDRQIVVETHSDYIIDRVRMDVRDKKTHLTHRDVSILYFERGDADVTIHSIEYDKNGNVLGAPNSYSRFFTEETRRSIGL